MPAVLDRPKPKRSPAEAELRWMVAAARTPKIRTMGEFCQAEIVIPTGPHEGMRFRYERQPWVKVLHDELQRRHWKKIAALGPRQTGKSLIFFVIPTLYNLFERQEGVIDFTPDDDMTNVKWQRDLLPVIQRTRYAKLLPDRGEGSAGGKVTSGVSFKNGVDLKFMTMAGRPKNRQGYTARVLVETEIDEGTKTAENNVVGTPLAQVEHCTDAYGDEAEIWGECTVTTKDGEIWTRYQNGTASEIRYPCPHCRQWVRPEREHLVGWQSAADVIAARESAHFQCPACEEPISEDMRQAMLFRGVLVHRGQRAVSGELLVVSGEDEKTTHHSPLTTHDAWSWRRWSFDFGPSAELLGDMVPTDTLGFRWSAFDNKFRPAAKIAEEEWLARRSENSEEQEQSLCQNTWAVPYTPPITENVELKVHELAARTRPIDAGLIPATAKRVTVFCDIGKKLGNFLVCAWDDFFTGWIVEYGLFEVEGHTMATDLAVTAALTKLRDKFSVGFPQEGTDKRRMPDVCFVDSRWSRPGVCAFMRDPKTDVPGSPHRRWWPTEGYGEGTYNGAYTAPKAKSKSIVWLGDEYHFVKDAVEKVVFVAINSDEWKSRWHTAISLPVIDDNKSPLFGQYPPGSVALHRGSAEDHYPIARHWTAEKQVTVAHPEKGRIVRWIRIGGRPNHYLDCGAGAMCAAHFCGIRGVPASQEPAARSQEPEQRKALTMPDGRPFFVGERQ